MSPEPVALVLVLPVPPSPNKWATHRMVQHRQKRRYQAQCWAAAIQQQRPPRDPPARVRLDATFYIRNRRDEDGLKGSLKWALDALRQQQMGSLRWRQGLYDECGYFVDDNPRVCEVAEPVQHIDRKEPHMLLRIVPVPDEVSHVHPDRDCHALRARDRARDGRARAHAARDRRVRRRGPQRARPAGSCEPNPIGFVPPARSKF